MAEPTNLSAGIPTYDFATQGAGNAIEANSVTSPLGNGSIQLAQEIQRNNQPQSIDLSHPLTGTTATDSLWSTDSQKKPSLEVWNSNLNDAYTKLNNGTYIPTFKNYISGIDNEDRLAQQQGVGEKWLNGLQKFGAKTGLNVLDATVGTVNGLIQGASKGSLSAIYNNDFSKWVDDLNTRLDKNLPNYYRQQERDFGFGSLGSANFWSDKVLGGMSFVAGTVISEAIWAAATDGLSLGTAEARIGLRAERLLGEGVKNQNKIIHSITSLMNGYQRTVPASQTLRAFNNARFLYTSAGYEAGVEARQFLKEAEANYLATFQQQNGRRPNGQELAEFKNNSLNAANGVFAANMALVGGSNIAQFGNIFGMSGLKSLEGLQRGVNRSLGIGIERTVETGIDTYRALSPSRLQRILGTTYNALKSPIREGVIEEGGQATLGDFGQRWLKSKYDADAMQDNFSAIDALGESLAQTYGTSKGLEEVALGSIIGLISPIATARLSGQGVSESLGLKEFSNAIKEQERLAGYANQNSNYNLATKFFQASSQKAATQQMSKNFGQEKGTEASQEINLAMFSKFQTEDLMGLLDDSGANFAQSLNELDVQELAQQLNMSEEEAASTKENAIATHAQNLQDYKKAQKVAENLFPEGVSIKVGGENSFLPAEDAQSHLALNIYMSRNSDRLSRAYAQSISDTIGDNGIAPALRIESMLQDKQVSKSREVRKLTKELTTIENTLARRNNELIRISAQPRTEAGDAKLTNFENRRQEIIAQQERDTTRREEIQQELTQVAEQLNQVRKARNVANQNFSEDFRDGDVTADSLIQAAQSLETLGSTLDLWRTNGQEKAAKDVEYLVNEFDKSQKAWVFANEAFNRLADPRLAQKEFSGIFSPMLSKFKKAGLDISDYKKAESELFKVLAAQYAHLKTIRTNFDEITTPQQEQTAVTDGDTLPTIQTQETDLDQRTAKEIKEEYQQRRTVELSEQELKDLDVQEQAELDAIAPILNTPTTLKDALQEKVDELLKGRRDIEQISEPIPAPTNAQREEFKRLYERNRKSRNGLKPQDAERFEELKDVFNNYGRAVGTYQGGARLADLLEQIYGLENLENTQETVPTINNTNTAEIQAQLTTSGAGVDTSAKTQYWEKSEFRVLPEGTFSITGINMQGLLDIINTSNNAVILRDKTRKQVAGQLTGEKYKPNDKFIIEFEQGVEIGVKIGETNNLIINPKAVELLNERTRFKIIPSTTLGTSYQPLLQELNSNAAVTPLEVVNTNFELEPGLSFTDFTNKPDDTELGLFVSTRNEYNKKLLRDYQNGKIKLFDLQKKLVIYAMSADGEVGGVLKALNKNIQDADGNYAELSQIRNIAAQRAIENNLENALIDVQMIVPTDRNNSNFGKPNFNLILNKETGVLSTELLNISDKAMDKIVDVGYIQNGRTTLKENKKETSKINTAYVKKASQGKRLPIVVFNYNGSRIAYPVSVREVEVDKVAEFNDILNAPLPLSQKIQNLNQYLFDNDIDPNVIGLGFYNVAGDTNIDDAEHIENIRNILKSQLSYNDFTEWLNAPNLEAAKALMQQQAQINIDITDKPFHSPKLGLKLKDRVIIGDVQSPSRVITEAVEKIDTQEIISENTCG